MRKYKIRREFFPFSHFTPPISEKFLAMAVPHMKTPKFIYKDKALNETKGTMHGYDIVQKTAITKASLEARIQFMREQYYGR